MRATEIFPTKVARDTGFALSDVVAVLGELATGDDQHRVLDGWVRVECPRGDGHRVLRDFPLAEGVPAALDCVEHGEVPFDPAHARLLFKFRPDYIVDPSKKKRPMLLPRRWRLWQTRSSIWNESAR